MRSRLAALSAAAAITAGGLAVGTTAAADAPEAGKAAGARCVIAGIGFLSQNDLLQAAAQRQIDYSALADPEDGPIFTTLPEGSFLSLGEVVRLHVTDPDLFAWCR